MADENDVSKRDAIEQLGITRYKFDALVKVLGVRPVRRGRDYRKLLYSQDDLARIRRALVESKPVGGKGQA